MSATIDSNEFILLDNWPTLSNNNSAGPHNAMAPASGSDHNIASPAYALGTKFVGRQRGATGTNQGEYTLIYLKLGTQDASGSALAAKGICCLAVAPGAATAAAVLYTVTNADASAILQSGMCAIALSAMTDDYYGWFWCGGVCPETICSGLAGNYLTDGNVVVGGMRLVQSSAVATQIGFGTVSGASVFAGICFPATDAA